MRRISSLTRLVLAIGLCLSAIVSAGCQEQGTRGPISVRNPTETAVLVRLDTVRGSWLVGPGQQVTLIDYQPSQITGGAFLVLPGMCAHLDMAFLRDRGPLLLTVEPGVPRFDGIGPSLRFSVSSLDGPVAPVTPAGYNGCPDIGDPTPLPTSSPS